MEHPCDRCAELAAEVVRLRRRVQELEEQVREMSPAYEWFASRVVRTWIVPKGPGEA